MTSTIRSYLSSAFSMNSSTGSNILMVFTVVDGKIESGTDMPPASISVVVGILFAGEDAVVTGEDEVLVDRVKDVVAMVTGEDKVLVDRVKDVVGERFDVVDGGVGVCREDDVCAEDFVGGGKVEVVVRKDAVDLGGGEPAGHQRC